MSIDDVYVIVTPLPPADASEKESTPVVEEVKESTPVIEEVKETPKEEAPKEEAATESKAVDDGGIMDLSGAFDLATVLTNNFEFSMRRLHVRVEGNPASPIPLFSLGIAIDEMKLDTIDPTEKVSESNLRKSFRMDGFSLYWCINDKVLIAEASPEVRIAGMRGFFGGKEASPIAYDKNDRLLDDLHMHVQIVGDLRKIEDRMRSEEECMALMKKDCKVDESNPVDALVVARLQKLDRKDLSMTRREYAQHLRNQLKEEDEDYKVVMGLRARELAECYWEYAKTPLPMLRVEVVIEKVDLEIEKSQYENIICFANDFLNSLPKSDAPAVEDKPAEQAEQTEQAVQAEQAEQATPKPEAEAAEVVPHYTFGVVPFVLVVANYLLTSYVPFCGLVVFLFAFPVLLFKHFFQALLMLLTLGGVVGYAWWRCQQRNKKDNERVDVAVHQRDNLVEAGVLLNAFELRLNNDMVPNRDVEHIMALCMNEMGVSANVTKASIGVELLIRDVHIVDQVASELQQRERYMMCVCDVDESGCPTHVIPTPLLQASVKLIPASSPLSALSKQDIGVAVNLGQVNVVLSRVLVYSVLRFVAPSKSVKELLRKAAEKADETTKQLKEMSDAMVTAPPKPIPADWERKSVVVTLHMVGAAIMLDSEEDGLVMSAGVSGIKGEVAICAAKLSAYFNIHDACVNDLTKGCGLYRGVVAIRHGEIDDSASNDFLDAGVTLYNDDRWPRYPGFSLEAKCSIGAPVLTVRMRFIQEVLNYVMNGPLMEGIQLLSADDDALTASGNLPEIEEAASEPRAETQIMENIVETAKTIGMQYIVTNAEGEDHVANIIQNLEGVAANLKRRFIVPNPHDDIVPTEIPKIDVVIANTLLQIPRSSTSADLLACRLGRITIRNSAPELVNPDGLEVNKGSVVYTLNCIALNVSGVTLYSTVSGVTQSIMGSIDMSLTVIAAVKIEAAIYLSRIVLALSEGQVLTLIHLLTENLNEKALVMKPAEAKPAPKKEEPKKEEPNRGSNIAVRASHRLSSQIQEAKEEAKLEEAKLEDIEENEEEEFSFLPRNDSSASLSSLSPMELTDSVVLEEEKPPVEHNGSFADRIHVNLLFDGITVELFRENHGYEGLQSSSAMYKKVGTVEGSLAAISMNELTIGAYYHNMDISASISLSTILVRDSRPESPIAPHFRNLVQIGEENKPAFSVIVALQQKTLGDLHGVIMNSDHKVNEPVFDVETSLFIGQVALLPSPWIFVMLDWASAVGGKVGAAFTEATKSLESEEEVKEEVKEEKEEVKEEKSEEVKEEKEKEEKEEEKKPAALIPNVVVKMHMERMAMYVVENCCDAASPVFLCCFGVELNTHVSPFLDIALGMSVNNTRAARSTADLRLLPTDMRDALYPFTLRVDVSLTEQLKKVRARVHAVDIVMRLGILDAKLVLNAITNLLPAATEEVKEKVKDNVKEEVKDKMTKEDEEVKEEVVEVKKEESVEPAEPAMYIEANVVFEKIAFILVNDAKAFELPVLQFNINQVKVDAAMGANLYCHVLCAFSSDYYKSSQALWEPFMESWSMNIHVKQIKNKSEKDPYMPQDATSQEKDSDAMQVVIDAPRMLQMNLTATLLSALVETLSDFMNCLGGKREQTDGFFVMVQNSTGFDMTYRIEKDGGINEMMMMLESHATEELAQDHVVYAGVCDVVDSYRTRSRWLEYHSCAPHLRLYSQVPLLCEESSAVLSTNTMETSDATCGHIFPIVSTLKHAHMTYYLEQFNDHMRDRLVERFDEIQKDAQTPRDLEKLKETIKQSYAQRWVTVPKEGVVSTMPAHPSLALLFLKQNYRKIPDRRVMLSVDGFEPISCEVDRERTVFVQLQHKDGTVYDALLVNGIKNGRKVIDIVSPVSVENVSSNTVSVEFVNGKNEEEKSAYTLKHRMHEACPLKWCKDASIVIRCEGHEGQGVMKVEDIQNETLASYLNVGTEEEPFFMRVMIHKDTVYDIYNKQSVDSFRVTLAPVMMIMNLLPMPMQYCIWQGEEQLDEETIEEGEEVKCFDVALVGKEQEDETVRVSIMPDGCPYFTTPAESIIPWSLEKRQSVAIRDVMGRKVRLSYKAIADMNGTISIQVYCDFWLLNRTGEEVFIQEKGAKNTDPVVLPAVKCPIVKLSSFKFDKKERVQPVLFSFSDPDSRSRAMLLRTAHSKWCNDGVTIDALGSSTRFCLPEKKDEASDGKKRVFGVNVVPAPSMFANTYVVTITPGLFISNHTKDELALRLGTKETSPVTRVGAGETIAYHCPTVVDKVQLSVQIDALATEWTEPFDVTKEEQDEMLVFKGESEKEKVLRMRAAMNGAQREVVFDYADAFNTFLFKQQMEKKKSFLQVGKKEEVNIASLLEECDENKEKKEGKETVNVNVNFGGVGISLVDQKPQEIMYVCVDDFKCQFILCDDGKIALGATLMKCQIDSGVPGSKYPVFFGSTEAGEPNPEYDEEHPDGELPYKPFFQLSLSMPSHPSILFLEYLGVCMQPMMCAIDSGTLVGLIGVVSELSIHVEDVQQAKGSEVLERSVLFTSANTVSDIVGKSYILADNFIMQPIIIKFSYHNDPSAPLSASLLPQNPRLMPLFSVFNTITNLVGNLDNATINLRSLLLTNYYTDVVAFAKKVATFYALEVMNKFYLLVGSFNVIGNPTELVGNVADGVKAFFMEPVQGLMKGPGAFVGGLGKGTTQLVSKTAFGLLNSVSKITSTVGDGVAAMAMSDSYQADRAAGKSNLVHGVWSGVTGVFTETSQGFKEKGVIGAVTGLGKGVIGAGAKTVTGAIDSVTHVVNGVKDVTHKEKTLDPIRSPRYIPLDNVLESYNAHLSDGIALLQMANRGSGIHLEPKERYVIHCTVDNGTNCLILTTRQFILVTPRGKLLGVASFGALEYKRNGQELEVIPTRGKSQKQLVRAMDSAVNQLTSHVDGELRLKQCSLLIESEKLCSEIEAYCLGVRSMTMDEIADAVRRMMPLIHAEASGEEEEPEETKRAVPVLEELGLKSLRYESKKRVSCKENGIATKEVTQYKVEVTSTGDQAAVWYVYIRYNDLEWA